jgi:hypothetical protein
MHFFIVSVLLFCTAIAQDVTSMKSSPTEVDPLIDECRTSICHAHAELNEIKEEWKTFQELLKQRMPLA